MFGSINSMPRLITHCQLALFGCAMLLFCSCATNPVTGRQDLVFMSEQDELDLGRQYHREVLKKYPPYPDAALQAYVKTVGTRVAAESHRPELIYHFLVVDSKEVNAFALPGGYIYITRGLLAYLNSEAELAAVLGHEIGHVTARHAVRQHSAAQMAGIGATVASILVPQLGTIYGSQLINVLGTALLRGYGRDHELEADRLGAEYLSRSGYSASSMIDVIGVLKHQQEFDAKLAAQEGREPRAYHGLFSTHPDHDKRLREIVDSVGRQGSRPGGDRESFLQQLDGLLLEEGEKEGVIRGQNFYHAELNFGVRFPPGWRIDNQASQLLAISPQGDAVVQLAAEDLNKRMPPREFMRTRLGLKKFLAEREISPAGLPAHSVVVDNFVPHERRRACVNVIYHQDVAYIIAGSVKPPAPIKPYMKDFVAVAESFHPLGPEEKESAKSLRIHVIRADASTTFVSLAADSPFETNKEARLRLLNGKYPVGEPVAGELLKTVR